VWMLSVTNRTKKPRDLSAWTYVEYANDWIVTSDQLDLQFSPKTNFFWLRFGGGGGVDYASC